MNELNNTAIQIAQIHADSARAFVIVLAITIIVTAWILRTK